ncbi:hypothetical protein ACFE04_016172 [Oxalis oulophora]
MVWFQCEVCGEELKKPKLPNHFRICSATKLSCIDCGQTFGQQTVQGHTQCISEAEKYGPKGPGGKTPNSANGKPNKEKQQPDFDITAGLSKRPPWFCSLCNTKATSEQTLLLHADGKKHRGKAKGFHLSQQPKPTEESAPVDKSSTQNTPNEVETKLEKFPKEDDTSTNLEADNGKSPSKKKRKHDESESNGEVIQNGKGENGETKSEVKKAKNSADKEEKNGSISMDGETKKKPKLKKLITSTLKSNDGALKLKKLKKMVKKLLQDSGISGDDSQLSEKIDQEINSSSKFTVDKKYVRLAAKD